MDNFGLGPIHDDWEMTYAESPNGWLYYDPRKGYFDYGSPPAKPAQKPLSGEVARTLKPLWSLSETERKAVTRVFRTDTTKPVALTDSKDFDWVSFATTSRSGRLIGLVGGHSIGVWDEQGKRLVKEQTRYERVSFSEDEKTVLAESFATIAAFDVANGRKRWDVADAVVPLRGPYLLDDDAPFAMWAPSGDRIARPGVGVMSVATGVVLWKAPVYFAHHAWTRDAQRVVVHADDQIDTEHGYPGGQLELRSAADGALVAKL